MHPAKKKQEEARKEMEAYNALRTKRKNALKESIKSFAEQIRSGRDVGWDSDKLAETILDVIDGDLE